MVLWKDVTANSCLSILGFVRATLRSLATCAIRIDACSLVMDEVIAPCPWLRLKAAISSCLPFTYGLQVGEVRAPVMLKMGGYGNQRTSCICLVHMWFEICKPESPAGSDKVLEQAAASKEGKFESRSSDFFRASFPGEAIRSWLALTIGQSQD